MTTAGDRVVGAANLNEVFPQTGEKRRSAMETSCPKRLRMESAVANDTFDDISCHHCHGLWCKDVLVGTPALRWVKAKSTCIHCFGKGRANQAPDPTPSFTGIWLHSVHLRRIQITEDQGVLTIQHPTVGTHQVDKAKFITGGFYGLCGAFQNCTSIKWTNGVQWKKIEQAVV